jgi:signal transduction histidine kinase
MSKASIARRNLGLGYALPIIGGAVALIIGLVVWDVTHTTFDAWIWILILAILGASLVFGTLLSNSAFNFAETTGKAVGSIRGAKNLNFVLGIIWSAVVTIKSFSDMAGAVSSLRNYNTSSVIIKEPVGGTPPVHNVYTGSSVKPLTWHILLTDFLPAFVLLGIAVVGIYLLLWERAKPANVASPSEDK